MGPFSRSRCTWAASAKHGLHALALSLGMVVLVTSAAHADALVSVQLKDSEGHPAEGKVTLLDSAGKAIATCEARAGKCDMVDVPGGTFTVTVQPKQGAAPKPHKVLIPPRGKVALVVTSG